MTRVQAGYAITSIMNTNSEEVERDEPVLEVTEVEPGNEGNLQERDVSDRHLNRAEEVLKRLRLEHLNEEERKQIKKRAQSIRTYFICQVKC
jgi:hypothetical protein